MHHDCAKSGQQRTIICASLRSGELERRGRLLLSSLLLQPPAHMGGGGGVYQRCRTSRRRAHATPATPPRIWTLQPRWWDAPVCWDQAKVSRSGVQLSDEASNGTRHTQIVRRAQPLVPNLGGATAAKKSRVARRVLASLVPRHLAGGWVGSQDTVEGGEVGGGRARRATPDHP